MDVDTQQKDKKCVLSLYASDVTYFPHYMNGDYGPKNMLRISPFSNPIIAYSVSPISNYKDIVESDGPNKIYYMELGTYSAKYQNLFLSTGAFEWPMTYTVLMWVKWNQSLSLCVSFDSASTVPLVLDERKLCVVNSHNWGRCKEKMDIDGWKFVAVCAGGIESSFYVGDLENEPKFTESVKRTIGGRFTERIGNGRQGPGKLAMIKVFNYGLGIDEMRNEYYQSKYEIAHQWNQQEAKEVVAILMEYASVREIVDCIAHYCYFRSYPLKD